MSQMKGLMQLVVPFDTYIKVIFLYNFHYIKIGVWNVKRCKTKCSSRIYEKFTINITCLPLYKTIYSDNNFLATNPMYLDDMIKDIVH